MDSFIEKRISITLLGEAKVGKSSIIKSFLGRSFDPTHTPTVEEIHQLTYHMQSEALDLIIYDVRNIDDSSNLINKLIERSDVFIVVFDLTRPASFARVARLQNRILNVKLNGSKGKVPILVAGWLTREQGRREGGEARLPVGDE